MENLTLHALTQETAIALVSQSAREIVQVDERKIAIEFGPKKKLFLVFIVDAHDPFFFLAAPSPAKGFEPNDFVMLLRKWLRRLTLLRVEKRLSERIVHFQFGHARDQHLRVEFIAECVPHFSNLYLLDEQRLVLGSFSSAVASRRGIVLHQAYHPPKARSPHSLDAWLTEDREKDRTETPPGTDTSEAAKLLSRRVAGLSPLWATELLKRSQETQTALRWIAKQMIEEASTAKGGGVLYRIASPTFSSVQSIVLPCAFTSLAHAEARTFPSLSDALSQLEKENKFLALAEERRKQLRQPFDRELRRNKKILEKLAKEQETFAKETQLQKFGDLLLVNVAHLSMRQDVVEVDDVFSSPPQRIRIPLDPRWSVQENAQSFYERAKRGRRGLEQIQARTAQIEKTIQELERRRDSLDRATPEELHLLPPQAKVRLSEHEADRSSGRRKAPIPQPKKWKCRVFQSSEGATILVGRNSKENDRVTKEYAQPDDYWFHVADYAGSHVVLKNPDRKNLENEPSFLEAAQLAAYFSPARNAKKVSVHWTQKKFVSKPRRAKPGLVRLSKFQTAVVEPKRITPEEENLS